MGGDLGAVTHPVLLEVHRAPLPVVGVVDDDVGLDAVVGHRQQRDARLPAPAQGRGHGAERVAGVEHLRAHQVGGDVAVTQAEPRRLHAVRRELLARVPGLVPATPAALGVDAVAEGVHDRVQVGADLEAVHPQVVRGVGHDGDLGVGSGAAHELQDTPQEAGAADAAREDRHTGGEVGAGQRPGDSRRHLRKRIVRHGRQCPPGPANTTVRLDGSGTTGM
ncbi:hypothetical protein GCM10027596_10590 [Nocardioides korecus]